MESVLNRPPRPEPTLSFFSVETEAPNSQPLKLQPHGMNIPAGTATSTSCRTQRPTRKKPRGAGAPEAPPAGGMYHCLAWPHLVVQRSAPLPWGWLRGSRKQPV